MVLLIRKLQSRFPAVGGLHTFATLSFVVLVCHTIRNQATLPAVEGPLTKLTPRPAIEVEQKKEPLYAVEEEISTTPTHNSVALVYHNPNLQVIPPVVDGLLIIDIPNSAALV